MERVATWVRENWFVLCCMAVAAVIAIVVRDQVFPRYGPNRDEPVYVLQAETLKAGHFTLPRYTNLRYFQPWLTGVVHGRLVFEFPPGWPAFLAVVSLLTGSMVPALPIVAALVVLGMYQLAREASGRRSVASVAAAVTVLTPIVVIQSGQLLSYLFTLALGCFAGAALLRGARTGRAAPLVVGGLLLGVVLLARPFDALLWGLPFAVYVLVRAARNTGGLRHGAVEVFRRMGWIAVGFVPPALCMATFNLLVTARPTRFPIEAADPRNTFGFGERRIMRGASLVRYTGHDALDALAENFRHAPPWVLGSWVGIALAVVGAYLSRRRGATYVLLGLVATFAFGYFFYWGLALMGAGAIFVGPQYYLPMAVPVVVLGATALTGCWKWRRPLGVLVAVVLVAVSGPWLVDRADANYAFATERFAVAAERLDGFDAHDALVFVPAFPDPYLLSYLPFAANTPALDGDRIYAVDVAPDLVDLVDATDRAPYRLAFESSEGPGGLIANMTVRRLRVVKGATLEITARVTNPGKASVVTAYLETANGNERVVLDRASVRGATYDVSWTVAAPASASDDATTMPEGLGWLDVGVRFGPDALDLRAPDADAVAELRYATRTTSNAITAVVPPRRFGLVNTTFGRLLAEAPPDHAFEAEVAPGSASS